MSFDPNRVDAAIRAAQTANKPQIFNGQGVPHPISPWVPRDGAVTTIGEQLIQLADDVDAKGVEVSDGVNPPVENAQTLLIEGTGAANVVVAAGAPGVAQVTVSVPLADPAMMLTAAKGATDAPIAPIAYTPQADGADELLVPVGVDIDGTNIEDFALGARLLLFGQADGVQNGVWVVTTINPGVDVLLVRAADYRLEQDAGKMITALAGTMFADKVFLQTEPSTRMIIVGGVAGEVLTFQVYPLAGGGGSSNVVAMSVGAAVSDPDNFVFATWAELIAGINAVSKPRKINVQIITPGGGTPFTIPDGGPWDLEGVTFSGDPIADPGDTVVATGVNTRFAPPPDGFRNLFLLIGALAPAPTGAAIPLMLMAEMTSPLVLENVVVNQFIAGSQPILAGPPAPVADLFPLVLEGNTNLHTLAGGAASPIVDLRSNGGTNFPIQLRDAARIGAEALANTGPDPGSFRIIGTDFQGVGEQALWAGAPGGSQLLYEKAPVSQSAVGGLAIAGGSVNLSAVLPTTAAADWALLTISNAGASATPQVILPALNAQTAKAGMTLLLQFTNPDGANPNPITQLRLTSVFVPGSGSTDHFVAVPSAADAALSHNSLILPLRLAGYTAAGLAIWVVTGAPYYGNFMGGV